MHSTHTDQAKHTRRGFSRHAWACPVRPRTNPPRTFRTDLVVMDQTSIDGRDDHTELVDSVVASGLSDVSERTVAVAEGTREYS
jgi:hypothetical protein